jgi:hypothetical protein
MKNQLTIAGGLLTAVAMFLPMASAFGIGVKMLDNPDGVGYFWIVCGAIIAIVGFVDKKKLNILSLILGLAVAALAIKYQQDISGLLGTTGIGIWVMLAGGILSVVGSVKRLRED